MTNLLSQAKEYFLFDNGLTLQNLEQILGNLAANDVTLADLYFETSQQESWLLEDNKIKRNHASFDTGFGLRTIIESTANLAYSNFLTIEALKKAASFVRQATTNNQSNQQSIHLNQPISFKPFYTSNNPIDSLSDLEKVQLLQGIDRLARSLDSRICQVIASLSGSYQMLLIANTQGKLAADFRPLIRISISVVAKKGNRAETGSAGGGARTDYKFFTEEKIEQYTRRAVNQALLGFESKSAPSAVMPVVLGSGWPAVLLHESIGHGLEADAIRKKTSQFWNLKNKKIANDCCTIVDDATYPNARGSLNVDDEGERGQRTMLIEKGILKNFMQDKLNAHLMHLPTTGNGRREGYNYLPIPRMTNTYLLPGAYEPQEIISSVKKGLYAVDFSGGQVDVTSGKFVFSAKEAYLIENGKITQPVKNASLIGDGPTVLHKVSMVGNDLKLDPGVGVCGKDGQSVPVGIGQPTVKVDAMTVGGTAL
jgi:TldD protein